MSVATDIVAWAASQIGVKESPANSNRVKYWDMYKERCGIGWQGSPWCAAFASIAWDIAGADKMKKDLGRYRYCPDIVTDAKASGQWRTREQGGQPGDKIVFSNGSRACHVGIVEKVISGTVYQTIEGNTGTSSNDNGGAVMRRRRELGTVGSSWYVLGFVRPNGSASSNATTAKPSDPKLDTVVTEVINGKWGNNPERSDKLKAAGYDPAEIQRLVNIKLDVAQPTPVPEKPSGFSNGLYQVQVSDFLRVRTGAGTGYRAKTKNEVTANAQANWKSKGSDGGLRNGTRCTVSDVKYTNNEIWGLIPSGWICLQQNGSTFAKKVG